MKPSETPQAKVLIPLEAADVIEYLRDDRNGCHRWSNEEITSLYANNGHYDSYQDEARDLRKIPFDTLMRALLDGYERELTEEEARHKVVADEYAEYVYGVQQRETEAEDYAYADGIVFTLNALGIKIMGVNTAFTTEGGAA